jgi:hypothetical protein
MNRACANTEHRVSFAPPRKLNGGRVLVLYSLAPSFEYKSMNSFSRNAVRFVCCIQHEIGSVCGTSVVEGKD